MGYNVEPVKFNDVKYVGYPNDRLILKACYTVGEQFIEEEMFIYEGELRFRYEGSRLKRFCDNGKIAKWSYERTMDHIRKDVNRWCRNLGLPELIEKTFTEET